MDMFFIVRKANELKVSCAEIIKAAFSLEQVQKILISSGKRDRIYKPVTTWGIWLGQTLSFDHSCRNALAGAKSAGVLPRKISIHTGGYCQARNRLKEKALRMIGIGLGKELIKSEKPGERWHGRRVIIPDGSSVSLPDTLSNQKVYPQPNTQSAGCGFPGGIWGHVRINKCGDRDSPDRREGNGSLVLVNDSLVLVKVSMMSWNGSLT